jgi:putative SOS response-associated peptidase YedK
MKTSLNFRVEAADEDVVVTLDGTKARWGLIPFWMKEKPKVPHINARAVNGDVYQRRDFTSGRSAKMASSLIASVVKTLNLSPFAGVWEFARLGGQDTLSTARIVGEANPLVGGVHDRMPVTLIL